MDEHRLQALETRLKDLEDRARPWVKARLAEALAAPQTCLLAGALGAAAAVLLRLVL